MWRSCAGLVHKMDSGAGQARAKCVCVVCNPGQAWAACVCAHVHACLRNLVHTTDWDSGQFWAACVCVVRVCLSPGKLWKNKINSLIGSCGGGNGSVIQWVSWSGVPIFYLSPCHCAGGDLLSKLVHTGGRLPQISGEVCVVVTPLAQKILPFLLS